VDAVLDNLPLYWEGFRTTLVLALISGVLSLVIGVLLAACRVSPVPVLRALGTTYVELLRNTPLTMIFFAVTTVFPVVLLRLSPLPGAVVALTLYTSAFVCEVVRSGINGIPVGQAEAARSVGMTFGQTLTTVVLPQAVRGVLPPLVNVFIALAKNTSVAGGGFFVFELFGVGRRLTNEYPAGITEVLIGVAIFYLLITVPAGQLVGVLERKVAVLR
jgi:glutamate transport system permease protein